MVAPDIVLVTPDTPEQFDATRAIFREYAAGLGVDLCFQNFEAELAALPGDYAAPRGALLLALRRRRGRRLRRVAAARPTPTTPTPAR